MAMHFSGVWRNFCGAQCEEQRSCKKMERELEARGFSVRVWRTISVFIMFIGKNTARVLLHWEIGFECSDRLDAAEFRCCLHYVGCLVLFFPININSFNTLCQRWAALSFFLSTLIDSTHYDRGGLAGRMLERGWSIPPLPPTSIYYFALSITIFTIFYSVLLLLYYCSIYYTFS